MAMWIVVDSLPTSRLVKHAFSTYLPRQAMSTVRQVNISVLVTFVHVGACIINQFKHDHFVAFILSPELIDSKCKTPAA